MAPKRKKPSLKPYMVGATLLYGNFTWLDRHEGGLLTLHVGPAAKHYRTIAPTLKLWLELLQRIGIVSELKWHSHWAQIRMAVPAGMCLSSYPPTPHREDGITLDLEPEERVE